MMRSVAVCLFGISYKEQYNHWNFGNKSIDYRFSLENYRKHIFSRMNNYDVYYSTYDNDMISQMEKDFEMLNGKIEKNGVIEGLGLSSLLQRNEMILKFEQMLKDKKYDWYLFTRFDLLFNFNFDDFKYDTEKINVLATLESPDLICDNFYVVSHKKINDFFGWMSNKYINAKNRHDVRFFGGHLNINILTGEKGKLVKDLQCYKIIRKSIN